MVYIPPENQEISTGSERKAFNLRYLKFDLDIFTITSTINYKQ